MNKGDFILRKMQPDDIIGGMKLSGAEGWNQTEKDWKFLIENPHNICLLVECSGEIIATTTAMNYSNQIAWIGMVLVDKRDRGKGISKLLLTNILKKLESLTSVKLDATATGQKIYKKFGFKDECVITRMTNSSLSSLSTENNDDILVEHIRSKDIQEIITYDEFIFGANRTKLIEYLVKEYPGKGWLLRRNNSIAGIALGRPGNKYHHVGPVFASNVIDAKILIAKALKELIDQPVVVDVLCDKEHLISWLNSIGFTKQREFVRMYKKENLLPGITENQYLICGPEFG